MKAQEYRYSDQQLTYWRREGNTPLLLLHGFPLDHSNWFEVLPLLSPEWDTILPDLPGMGRSTAAQLILSMEGMAHTLADLMSHLGIERFHVAGFSLGGYVALEMVDLIPGRISTCSLIATRANADTPQAKGIRNELIETIAKTGLTNYAEEYMEAVFSESFRQRRPEAVEKQKQVVAQTSVSNFQSIVRGIRDRRDHLETLNKTSTSIRIIGSESDQVIPLNDLKDMAQGRHPLKISKQQGHMLLNEDPQFVADWLNQIG